MWTISSRSIKTCEDVFTDLKFWEKNPSSSIALANLSWGERLVCMFHPTIQESNGPLVETNHSPTLPKRPPPPFSCFMWHQWLHMSNFCSITSPLSSNNSAAALTKSTSPSRARCCNPTNHASVATPLPRHKAQHAAKAFGNASDETETRDALKSKGTASHNFPSDKVPGTHHVRHRCIYAVYPVYPYYCIHSCMLGTMYI